MISLGFSPCPNDTFIFDALVNHRIDSEGLEFDLTITDVEELNQLAFLGKLMVSKVSFGTYLRIMNQYKLLDSGAALGRNCGPILVSREEYSMSDLPYLKIAIPGKNTTANLLLSFACPEAKNRSELLFSEIESAVLTGKYDVGLVIHESRFTYASKGLKKLADLGEYWENRTGSPIPLGGIVVRKDMPSDFQVKISQLIRKSVQYGFDHPDESKEYIKSLAQETSDEVIRQHINLYVNEFTLDLGLVGKNAIQTLINQAENIYF